MSTRFASSCAVNRRRQSFQRWRQWLARRRRLQHGVLVVQGRRRNIYWRQWRDAYAIEIRGHLLVARLESASLSRKWRRWRRAFGWRRLAQRLQVHFWVAHARACFTGWRDVSRAHRARLQRRREADSVAYVAEVCSLVAYRNVLSCIPLLCNAYLVFRRSGPGRHPYCVLPTPLQCAPPLPPYLRCSD